MIAAAFPPCPVTDYELLRQLCSHSKRPPDATWHQLGTEPNSAKWSELNSSEAQWPL